MIDFSNLDVKQRKKRHNKGKNAIEFPYIGLLEFEVFWCD
jgi:hypothetical protein